MKTRGLMTRQDGLDRYGHDVTIQRGGANDAKLIWLAPKMSRFALTTARPSVSFEAHAKRA